MATAMTSGTNQPETWSASRWMGARLRCASATICTMRASMVSRANLLGPHHEAAGAVHRAADDFDPGSLLTGIDSPVTIDSSTATWPSDHLAVDRHFLAGAHAQASPTAICSMSTSSSTAIRHHAACRLGRQAEQRPDGAARLLARPESSTCPRSTSLITAAASK